MDSVDYAALAEIVQYAIDSKDQQAMIFKEEHGSSWNRNSPVSHRQSVLRARLRDHPHFELVEDRASEFGRIRFTPRAAGGPILLKPRGYLRNASTPDSETGIQDPLLDDLAFEGSASRPERVIGYYVSGETVILYEGFCREVRNNGRRGHEIVGQMRRVWGNTDTEPSFDQEEETDWLDDLDEDRQEDETGEGS